ncbi:hypothetical protein [Prochlorococcus sp. MIT 1306]|uniref:hypothetical protein n=1 Tax=Prochlorococcus sp. MIT 1306 TaxID=1799667 RepID=UPI0007BBA04A|nr:hypothetical protein [Prochlorococcus sp. MIT 1306]KZR64905.1 hypothetical protein PMIT1306_00581 [Prochlorococcus sp. MIT 1306]
MFNGWQDNQGSSLVSPKACRLFIIIVHWQRFYNYGWLRKVDITHDLDRVINNSKIAMQAAQLKVFLAKLKSEPLLQSQLTTEGADIVSTAKVASLFIDSNESTTEAVVELSDQEIKDQIIDALSKRNNPSISPVIIWAALLTVLLIVVGVFLNLKY